MSEQDDRTAETVPDSVSQPPDPAISGAPTISLAFSGMETGTPSSIEPGARFGPYIVHRLLGRGGMGEVWEAEHSESGRRLAPKVLSQALVDHAARERFLREGRLAAAISHPNSVYVFGTEEISGAPVITMELASGGTLKERVQKDGPLTPAKAVDAILQVIDGLAAAHRAGVLHRDIKPSNCFMDRGDTVKVGDFGLSISTLAGKDMQLTASGVFLGTPAFGPPEQIRCEDLDIRSDIYSVGATLYYILTGRAPFEDKRGSRLLAAVLEKPPRPPRTLKPEIPEGLERTVLRCLEKDPARRFVDYEQLRDSLVPFSTVRPIPASFRLRFMAGIVDFILCALAAGLTMTVPKITDLLPSQSEDLQSSILEVIIGVIYFTIIEGIRGVSVGKALMGLRLIGPMGDIPGISRAGRRALVFFGIFYLPDLLFASAAAMAFGARLLFLSFLFLTARNGNGLAGLHDLASGTRVVTARRRQAAPKSIPEKGRTEGVAAEGTVGPYTIRNTLWSRGEERLLLCHDPLLRRDLWILVAPPGSAPVSPGRQRASRSGSLYWISGRRTNEESWDAYEAPNGVAFTDLIGDPGSWSSVRSWIYDLIVELRAGKADGTLPPALGMEHLWIGQDNHLRILDFVAPARKGYASLKGPSTPEDTSSVNLHQFIHQVAVQSARRPLPLHAHAFLQQLACGSFQDLDALEARFREILPRPPAVPRRMRAVQMSLLAFLPAIYLLVGLTLSAQQQFWERRHPDMRILRLCLERLYSLSGDYTAYEVGKKIGAAAAEASYGASGQPSARESAAQKVRELRQERDREFEIQQLGIYLVSRYRKELSDDSVSWNPSLTETRRGRFRAMAKKLLSQHASISPEGLADAERNMKGFLDEAGRPETLKSYLVPNLLAAQLFLTLEGFLSLALALIFAGGASLSYFGFAVVMADNTPASRGRALWRAFLAWSLVFAAALLTPVLTILYGLSRQPYDAALLSFGSMIPLWGGILFGAYYAVRHPDRGLQDRIAGTYLVPK